MALEDMAAQYGLVGVALILMFKMYMANLKTIDKLSEALEKLNDAFHELKEEIRVMRAKFEGD